MNMLFFVVILNFFILYSIVPYNFSYNKMVIAQNSKNIIQSYDTKVK